MWTFSSMAHSAKSASRRNTSFTFTPYRPDLVCTQKAPSRRKAFRGKDQMMPMIFADYTASQQEARSSPAAAP